MHADISMEWNTMQGVKKNVLKECKLQSNVYSKNPIL